MGADGISRFGLATSRDGASFRRSILPWAEVAVGDWNGRLGIEDPRIVDINGRVYISYAKVGVAPAGEPKLSWEPAPFHIRSWLATTDGFDRLRELKSLLDRASKDLVLFPERIGGRYMGLIREYPGIQFITSEDLVNWSEPAPLLAPIAGGWEAERVGAGPPPLRTARGWLLLYHGNEFLQPKGNRRTYRMGMALLDGDEPFSHSVSSSGSRV